MKSDIMKDADAFVRALQETEEYKRFQMTKNRVKQFPELKARIDEFRRMTFEMQNASENENLMEDLELLQKQNESLLETPIVADFLQAELAFCRMMQKVNTHITEALDFE